MGERLAFLPSLGLIAFLVCILDTIRRQQGGRLMSHPLFVLLIVGLLLIRTGTRMPVWKNNAALFQQTVIDAPDSPKAHYNLAAEHYQNGENAEAFWHIQQSLRQHPEHLFSLELAADLALASGNQRLLRYYYKRILELNPNHRAKEELHKLEALHDPATEGVIKEHHTNEQ